MPWTLLRVQDDGTKVVVAYVIGDGCDTPLGFVVQESDSSVLLTDVSRETSDSCEQDLAGTTGVITLQRPLGDRRLVHAPVSKASR